jgi:hypothetical protein
MGKLEQKPRKSSESLESTLNKPFSNNLENLEELDKFLDTYN